MDFGRCPDQVQTCDELLMDEFELGISYDLVARSRLDVRFWDESEQTSQGQGAGLVSPTWMSRKGRKFGWINFGDRINGV